MSRTTVFVQGLAGAVLIACLVPSVGCVAPTTPAADPQPTGRTLEARLPDAVQEFMALDTRGRTTRTTPEAGVALLELDTDTTVHLFVKDDTGLHAVYFDDGQGGRTTSVPNYQGEVKLSTVAPCDCDDDGEDDAYEAEDSPLGQIDTDGDGAMDLDDEDDDNDGIADEDDDDDDGNGEADDDEDMDTDDDGEPDLCDDDDDNDGIADDDDDDDDGDGEVDDDSDGDGLSDDEDEDDDNDGMHDDDDDDDDDDGIADEDDDDHEAYDDDDDEEDDAHDVDDDDDEDDEDAGVTEEDAPVDGDAPAA